MTWNPRRWVEIRYRNKKNRWQFQWLPWSSMGQREKNEMAPERMESKHSFKIYIFKLLLFMKVCIRSECSQKNSLNQLWLTAISKQFLDAIPVNLLAWFNNTAPQLLFGWEYKEGTGNLRWKILQKHVLFNLNILLLKNRKNKETNNSDSAQNSGLVQNNLQGKKVLYISFLKKKKKENSPW
jgi:hypothetical protein